VTLDPPELVKVSGRVSLLPTCTFPKLKLGALAVSDPGVTPIPVTEAVSVALEALLAIERVDVLVPADCGAKTMAKDALWPADKVTGNPSPLTLYAPPEKLACVIVTLAPPALVNVAGKVWLLPTTTLPKLNEDGDIVNCPGVTPATVPAAAIPVPVRGMLAGFSAPATVIDNDPLIVPAAKGAN